MKLKQKLKKRSTLKAEIKALKDQVKAKEDELLTHYQDEFGMSDVDIGVAESMLDFFEAEMDKE